GTWRSNLYEYAPLNEWLPEADLGSVSPPEARAWLVGRYLAAFGPATMDDAQWWTGFTKTDTRKALKALAERVIEVPIEGLAGEHLMLAEDARALHDFAPPDEPFVSFLPSLDPYIMGYRDRQRFLAEEHRPQLFDRAGNSVPTVLVNGRVVGAWGQEKDGSVVYHLLEETTEEERALLDAEAARLATFLGEEHLPAGFLSPSFKRLAGGSDET
ncbi:MAG: winged helix DNA-binding domain-containing protein, partial [Anaerolineae bacterium]